MSRICWWLAGLLSRMLEADERDVVRGDFAESGETGGQALRDTLSIVARRQAALWKDWRPWLALIGVVGPLGMLLSLMSRHVADTSAVPIWLYVNNWQMAHLTNAGFRHDLAQYLVRISMEYATLMCWSWTSGFALASLSRRTIQVNGALFCLVLLFGELSGTPQSHYHAAVFAVPFYNTIFPWIVQTVLVLLPSLWGMHIVKEKNT